MLIEEKIQIAAIQESRLSDIPTLMGEYWSIHADLKVNSRGASIFVHKQIRFQHINFNLPEYPEIEITGVQILSKNPLFIYNVYVHPGKCIHKQLWENIGRDIQYPAIICGDFNCHHTSWGEPQDDPNGVSLFEWIQDEDLILLNDGTPTRRGHPGQRDTAIDLALISSRLYHKEMAHRSG